MWDGLKETIELLRQRGITVYAAHLKGKNCYDQEDYRTGCAFLIGNEGNGLSGELSRRADTWVRPYKVFYRPFKLYTKETFP